MFGAQHAQQLLLPRLNSALTQGLYHMHGSDPIISIAAMLLLLEIWMLAGQITGQPEVYAAERSMSPSTPCTVAPGVCIAAAGTHRRRVAPTPDSQSCMPCSANFGPVLRQTGNTTWVKQPLLCHHDTQYNIAQLRLHITRW
jgi:hypothetical protein